MVKTPSARMIHGLQRVFLVLIRYAPRRVRIASRLKQRKLLLLNILLLTSL